MADISDIQTGWRHVALTWVCRILAQWVKACLRLRLKAEEGIARVFYCTTVGKKIVMLHQFMKKTDKTPLRELETARRRMREIKNAHT